MAGKYYYVYKVVKVPVDGSHTEEEWNALCEKYDNRCVCCGTKKPLCVDHIIPRTKGGTNDISNIQPLCHSCNSHKSNKTIDYRLNPFMGDQPQARRPRKEILKSKHVSSGRVPAYLERLAENANLWYALPEDRRPKIVRKCGETKFIYRNQQYLVPNEMFQEE